VDLAGEQGADVGPDPVCVCTGELVQDPLGPAAETTAVITGALLYHYRSATVPLQEHYSTIKGALLYQQVAVRVTDRHYKLYYHVTSLL